MDVVFDADELVERATVTTGLSDFGAATWREGLDRLVDGFEHEARLNDIGVAMADAEVSAYLTNRLGIIEWRRTHPEVADIEVVRPIVIVGQPRTGTTILLDLLAQDPSNRAALTWEVDHPCPPPTLDRRGRRPAHRAVAGRTRHGRPPDPRVHGLPPDRRATRPGVRPDHGQRVPLA